MDDEELPPLVIRAALCALIWWEAVDAGDGGAPETCTTLAILEERTTFWMDWLLGAAAALGGTAAAAPDVHHEQTIRQSLGLGPRHSSRSNRDGVAWPWLHEAQVHGAPSWLDRKSACARLGLHMRVTLPRFPGPVR